MYLPDELPQAKVLITVKTYPLPSSKYEELVCTAGLLPDGKWIRIYPIPFRSLPYQEQYKKYNWIQMDLIRNSEDFRPESYNPKRRLDEEIRCLEKVDTSKNWEERKKLVLKEVHVSMNELIELAKGDKKRSLATVKPAEIVNFTLIASR